MRQPRMNYARVERRSYWISRVFGKSWVPYTMDFILIVAIAVLHSGRGVASFRYARCWTKQTSDL